MRIFNMRPKGKYYQKNKRFEKRWERIEGSSYLVTIPVSKYIRKLEKELGKKSIETTYKEPIYNKIYFWLWNKANYFWYNLD